MGANRLLAALLLLLQMLQPIHAMAGEPGMLGARETQPTPGTVNVTLYFRYRDSGLLAREYRQVSIPRNMPVEQAIVGALVEGPGSLSPHLSPPFPPGTQVLHVAAEGDTLFVTFNAGLMARYPDELPMPSPEYRQGEGRLRRQLAMASLVNTLTESGRYRQVQALVRDESYISTSMRLSARYYLEDSEAFPPPLTRQEAFIHSPFATAELFMSAWRDQDWPQALGLVRGGDPRTGDVLPTEHELSQRLSQAPRLIDFVLTPGIVALDGQSAVVSVTYTLLEADGQERPVQAFPLRLLRQDGVFLVPFDAALRMLELP